MNHDFSLMRSDESVCKSAKLKMIWDELWSLMNLFVKGISTLEVEGSMRPDGFHPKLLSSCQAVAYPIYLILKNSLQCGQLQHSGKNL